MPIKNGPGGKCGGRSHTQCRTSPGRPICHTQYLQPLALSDPNELALHVFTPLLYESMDMFTHLPPPWPTSYELHLARVGEHEDAELVDEAELVVQGGLQLLQGRGRGGGIQISVIGANFAPLEEKHPALIPVHLPRPVPVPQQYGTHPPHTQVPPNPTLPHTTFVLACVRSILAKSNTSSDSRRRMRIVFSHSVSLVLLAATISGMKLAHLRGQSDLRICTRRRRGVHGGA